MLNRLATASLDLPTLRRAIELLVDTLLHHQTHQDHERVAVTKSAAALLLGHPLVLGALVDDVALRANVRIILETRTYQSGPIYKDEVEKLISSAIWEATQQLAPRLTDWTDPSSARPVSTNAAP